MEQRRTRYGWTVRLDPGEELVTALTEFASRENVRAGALSGLGSVRDAELGYFVRARGAYERRAFGGDADYEILALTGNFSEREGRAFLHAHMVIAGPDYVAHGGHLFRGVIAVTCEAHIVTDPDVQRRRRREDLAFDALELR